MGGEAETTAAAAACCCCARCRRRPCPCPCPCPWPCPCPCPCCCIRVQRSVLTGLIRCVFCLSTHKGGIRPAAWVHASPNLLPPAATGRWYHGILHETDWSVTLLELAARGDTVGVGGRRSGKRHHRCGPRLHFGTPAAASNRLLLSHVCASDHAGVCPTSVYKFDEEGADTVSAAERGCPMLRRRRSLATTWRRGAMQRRGGTACRLLTSRPRNAICSSQFAALAQVALQRAVHGCQAMPV